MSYGHLHFPSDFSWAPKKASSINPDVKTLDSGDIKTNTNIIKVYVENLQALHIMED